MNHLQKLTELSSLCQSKEFAGGYVNTKQGVLAGSGIDSHFKRNAGKYIGSAVLTPLVGLPVGALIDHLRAKNNRILTNYEPKRAAAREFARGDRAIAALKKIVPQIEGQGVTIHNVGTEGTLVPAMRGNVGNVRRAHNKFWEETISNDEAAKTTQALRNHYAGTLKSVRASKPRSQSGSYASPVKAAFGVNLSAKTRLTELSRKVEFGLFTTNKPQYGANGQFQGMDKEMNPVGIASTGAALGAGGYGAYRANKAIMETGGYKNAMDTAAASARGAVSSGARQVGGMVPKGSKFGGIARGILAKLARI